MHNERTELEKKQEQENKKLDAQVEVANQELAKSNEKLKGAKIVLVNISCQFSFFIDT